MTAEPPRARLFFALDPDDQTRRELARWREGALGSRAGLRLPSAEKLHVTLAFLGDHPEEAIAAIAETGLAPAPTLSAPVLWARAVVRIPRRNPRLIALDLEDRAGHARELAAAVSGALVASGRHEPEDRPFWAHLTLARVQRQHARARSAERSLPSAPPRALTFDRVTLYRSFLGPSGARYEPVAQALLRPSGRPS